MSALGARCLVGFLFFFAFFTGCWIAGAGLHDPDTCWLLATGKYLFELGSIPPADPFSYSFASLFSDGTVEMKALVNNNTQPLGRPYVPYQWLTEILFFLSYKIGAGYGLLLLVNCVLVSAFIAGPLMLFRSLRAPMLPAVGLVILGVVASSFHFLARPEIFSYFMFTAMLGLFLRMRLKIENNRPFNKRDLTLLVLPSVMMIGWANLHTGFMSAFIALSILCLTLTVETLLRPRVRKSVIVLPWLMFLSLLIASMINPFGPGLWQYIPQLFFSPINKYIRELSSITVVHLSEWTFYPYFLLCGLALFIIAKAVGVWRKNGRFPIGWSYSVAASIGVMIAGICVLRLIPFVSIFLMAESAWLLKGFWRGETGERADGKSSEGAQAVVPKTMNDHVTRLLKDGSWPAMLLLLSIFGVFLISTRVVKPTIPQGSNVFPPPFKALSYLAENLPKGRVFNDAQYGDMMIWHLVSQEKPILTSDPFDCPVAKTKPKVFIDTRFDMYGAPLVGDYYVIRNAKAGWDAKFAQYRFDWVFLPEKAELAKQLKNSADWELVFNKEKALIFVRKKQ